MWGYQKWVKNSDLEDLGIHGRIIPNCSGNYSRKIWHGTQWQTIQFHKIKNFLTNSVTINFSRKTMHHTVSSLIWWNEDGQTTCEYQSARSSSFFASRPRRVCFFKPLWLSSFWTYRSTSHVSHNVLSYDRDQNIQSYFNNLQLPQVASWSELPFLSYQKSDHLTSGNQCQSASCNVPLIPTAALPLHPQHSSKNIIN